MKIKEKMASLDHISKILDYIHEQLLRNIKQY